MDRKQLAALLVVVVIGVGVALFAANEGDKETTDTSPVTAATSRATTSPAAAAQRAEIRFSGSSFSPGTLTVATGQGITIMNEGSRTIEIASEPHPTHTDFPALNLGDIAPGASKTVTISKPGAYGYHDHLNPSAKGTIVVQ